MSGYHRGAVAMLAEKAIKMASQLLILILLARYLGKENMGQLMYCYALASIVGFLNVLGLDTVLVKRLLDKPLQKLSYLKHALLLRLLAALICVLLVNSLGYWLVDEQSRLLLFVISLYHFFLPFSVYEWFYQSQGRGDLSAFGLIAGHACGFVVRLALLFSGADLLWFGLAYVLEVAITAVVYLLLGSNRKEQLPVRVSKDRAVGLLRDAWPLIISGAVVLLYMKLDQLMLGYIQGDSEVAIYVAATRLSEAWFFVGLTLIGVYFPKFIHIRKTKGEESYRSEVIRAGRWLLWGAITLSVITMFIAEWLVRFLYGQEFLTSAAVLIVTIWSVPFVYLGTISTKMYVLESRQKAVLWRSVVGLILNAALNLAFIEKYGALGAAYASLAAQIFASYLANAFMMKGMVFSVQTRVILGVPTRVKA